MNWARNKKEKLSAKSMTELINWRWVKGGDELLGDPRILLFLCIFLKTILTILKTYQQCHSLLLNLNAMQSSRSSRWLWFLKISIAYCFPSYSCWKRREGARRKQHWPPVSQTPILSTQYSVRTTNTVQTKAHVLSPSGSATRCTEHHALLCTILPTLYALEVVM